MKIAAVFCVHDDHWFLEESIRSFDKVPCYVFVSKLPWKGEEGDYKASVKAAKAAGAEVVLGSWAPEDPHRDSALDHMCSKGFTHVLIPDGDELIEPRLLDAALKIAENDLADRLSVEWDTYWKNAEYVIRPRERFTPTIMLNLAVARHVTIRHYEGGRPLHLTGEHGIIHHLSYAGPDERILRKISTWGHSHEVSPNWYERVFLGWDRDKLMRNLHPTHPGAYLVAERIAIPKALTAVAKKLERMRPPEQRSSPSPVKESISVVIPLHGGEDDIRACLSSLQTALPLTGRGKLPKHEIIVVDNGSPDGALEVAKQFKGVKFIELGENRGFAAACNIGAKAATGEFILFLNSDTVVPAAGLARLIESLMSSGVVGAAGPLTNRSGHHQQIDPTYASLGTMGLFAQDFAARSMPDRDVDMLVAFCLAIRKSTFEEIGGFDERFGVGTFEDNDLCYRLRRTGYRLVISSRAFVHHEGSKTLNRIGVDPERLLAGNQSIYEKKWAQDIESGFASHLSGFGPKPIEFDQALRPEARIERAKERAKLADISLCMIVRDEERVLGECLASAKPFFAEIIVVDTGSKDRTVEIAREHGAQVHEIKWPDSFAEARNESLKHATGRWIFWLDADDTLPLECGEKIVEAAIDAPKSVVGFVVPVRFVDDGPSAGVRVDHVKLFRRLPGAVFEGRIHEQILGNLRRPGTTIARLDAYVMHSGYDTSQEGQAKKRKRDEKLLKLDLRDRPNHPFVLFNLGMTAHYTADHDDAAAWLRKSIEASSPSDSHVRKAYALLSQSLERAGRADEAMATLCEGLLAAPKDPELHFLLGRMHADRGEWQEAKANYEAVAGSNIDGHFSSIDAGILGFKLYHNLAGVMLELGDYRAAKELWLRSLDTGPSAGSAICLFDAALTTGDLGAAREAMERLESLEGVSETWATMALRLGQALGDEAAALERVESAAIGTRSPGAALVTVRKLLELGDVERAMPHLRGLDEAGVAEAPYLLGVLLVREGDYQSALACMERSLALNPEHDQTQEQVRNLRALIASEG